jgi:hypothetical protein
MAAVEPVSGESRGIGSGHSGDRELRRLGCVLPKGGSNAGDVGAGTVVRHVDTAGNGGCRGTSPWGKRR